MILASANLLNEIVDHTLVKVNLFGMEITLFSATIASMLLAAAVVVAIAIPLSRRAQAVPSGGRNVLEVFVLFVRDWIARPALHDRAYQFLPFLLTVFAFVLAMNLVGLLPLRPLALLTGTPLFGTPTGILAVCGGLALLSLVTLTVLALRRQTLKYHHKGWPLALAAIASPLLWVAAFAPKIGGVAGAILVVPLMLLEFVGVLAKCFALMIRLFANMISGHTLLAVLAMLGLEALLSNLEHNLAGGVAVGAVTLAASVLVSLMELLVAAIQAYVFTFLTAMYIGLYADPAASH
jgi:F-type H+-transporting ATPase subunit a